MRRISLCALTLASLAVATSASAQIVVYEHGGFRGHSFSVGDAVGAAGRIELRDPASSMVVESDRWRVCEGANVGGRCSVLTRGRYPSVAAMGLTHRVAWLQVAGEGQWAREPDRDRDEHDDWRHHEGHYAFVAPAQRVPDFSRRGDEPLYEARVTEARAVVGEPGHRCWIEREQVAEAPGGNAPAAIAGAVIGGIIGHQIGGGVGKDLATAGGAVAGAAIGAQIGADAEVRAVRHCSGPPGPRRPDSWDVSYIWRGVEHRVQMTRPPGPTVTVNALGEPRE
jgi:Beta/Gamma crystallin/Glycine zipper 2TM domain